MFQRVLFGALFLLSATTAISATVVAATGIEHRHGTPALKGMRGPSPSTNESSPVARD